ncbi:MAG: hypothetical protein LBC35_00500 [Coriobacteriales bacterium]|jgi:hypothetical protein|nr:hypothetical protein [Coriobacteriales bacterium]
MKRFLDWNGSGHIDSQDLVTSVVLEESTTDEDSQPDSQSDPLFDPQSKDAPSPLAQGVGGPGTGCLLTTTAMLVGAVSIALLFGAL